MYTRPIGGWSASQAEGVVVVSQSALASSASKNRSTQRSFAPAMLPGRRPRPELLAVVAHHPDPLAIVGGVLAQVVDDLVHLAEGDPVAEPLLGPEDAQDVALVLGRVWAPEVLLGDGGRPEMRVIEDRPGIARGDQGGRQVGLPDALGEPRPVGPPPEDRLDLVGHPARLAEAVALGERGQDGLVQTATEDLDLAALDQRDQPVDEPGLLGAQPVEERPRVMEREADPRVAFQRRDHRLVGLSEDLGEDPAEVPDRLVVVDRERERDPRSHAGRLSRPRSRPAHSRPWPP